MQWMTRRLDSASTLPRPKSQSHNLVLVNGTYEQDDATSEPIRVLVASGGKLARAGLGALLDAQPEMTVIASAASEAEAVTLTTRLRPDVLLIDATPPGLDAGIDAVQVTRRIVSGPGTSAAQVLIVGSSEQDEEIFSSLRAGASGFLFDVEAVELVDGVRTVAAGEAALSSSGMRRVISELASRPNPRLPSPEQLDELTPREREVMALVAAGLSNDQIAEHLVVTNATAKTHVSRAMSKLRAHHRAQLVTLAYETGLVLVGQPAATHFGVPTASSVAA
jgi:DNA-binding NarL/FixJ family response regulator